MCKVDLSNDRSFSGKLRMSLEDDFNKVLISDLLIGREVVKAGGVVIGWRYTINGI